MNSNNAQVTVFIIIAIILVVGGGTGYYLVKSSGDKTSKEFFLREDIKPTMDNIKNSIIICSENSAEGSLEKIGIQGGFSKKPEKAYDLGWAFIPYYYERGSFLMPEKVTVERELGREYENQFLTCFKGINATGFVVKPGSSKTKASISKGNVLFNMDMPVTISKDENSMKIQMKDAPISQASKLYEILEIGRYITDSHKNDSEMICITCVADMAEERDLYVYSFDAMDNSVLMLVMDNSTSAQPYYFEWLNKYNPIVSTAPGIPGAPGVPGTR